MKIRIRSNSIRLRLTQKEVDCIAAGQTVRETTHFSLARRMECVLIPWNLSGIEATFDNHIITVSVPALKVSDWAHSDDEGLYGEQANGTDTPLTIAIEKDYACLKPRDEEDESDQFPNPESGSTKC